MSQFETTKGSSITHIDVYVDGWQAHCAEMGLSANPNKRFSEKWTYWKNAFLEAKRADKKNVLSDRELPANIYRERHKIYK